MVTRAGRQRAAGLWPVLLLVLMLPVGDCTISVQQERQAPPRDDLERAVFVADVELVRLLMGSAGTLKAGFPPVLVNRRDAMGRTALMKCGYDPQVKDRSRLDEDCAAIVEVLISGGAEVNVEDEKGWTAMAYAAAMGFTEVVGALADAGAVIDSRDEHQRTPLMKAVANGHLTTVRRLIAREAGVDVVDDGGWTPLIFAVRNSMNSYWTETVRYLASISVPSTLNAQDKHGRTALMYAVNIGNVDAIKILLEAEADVTIQDDQGWTAISLTQDADVQAVLQDSIVRDSARRFGDWRDQRGEVVEKEREERLLRALEKAVMLETMEL